MCKRIEANRRLAEISQALRGDVPPDGDAVRVWVDEIASMAPLTWYACECGPIAPTAGDIDAICPDCGAMRKLPSRLDVASWSLYVRCVAIVYCDWFDRLAVALAKRDLIATRESDAIECIDGMKISRDATVCAIPWIALPMPSTTELD